MHGFTVGNISNINSRNNLINANSRAFLSQEHRPTSSYANSPKHNNISHIYKYNQNKFNNDRITIDKRDKSSVYQFGQKMRYMKSKISHNLTIQSRNGTNDSNLYPAQLIFLLSNEDGNMQHIKSLIEEDKKRVERDFDNFTQEVVHIISDLRLSVQSKLDTVFCDFIKMYQSMKDQVTKMREQRQRILHMNNRENEGIEIRSPRKSQFLLHNNANHNSSNLNILEELSRDEHYFKNHKLYEEITGAYFQAIGPIMMEAQNILTIGSEIQFYKDDRCCHLLNMIRDNFFNSTKTAYGQELNSLVTQVSEILEDNNMLLKGLNIDETKYERKQQNTINIKQRQKQKQSMMNASSYKKRSETQTNPYGFEPPTFKNNFEQQPKKQKYKILRPSSSSEYLKHRSRPESHHSNHRNQNYGVFGSKTHRQFELQKQKYTITTNTAPSRILKVSRDEQNVLVQWVQSPKLVKSNTINVYNAQDILLCILFINGGREIAVGSKDRNIYIFSTINYKYINTLSGHRASVCSMANFGHFFASGGDNGCGSLILWEAQNCKMKKKVNLHSAALTCIVDCLDGTHLATGGYDKKITVYNYKKGESAFEVNSCKSGVTCIVVCEQFRKLVSAGLDSTLTVWSIFTKNGQIETITLQKIITNCGLVCSLRPLILLGDVIMVGNKQGRILMVNLHNGQILKNTIAGRGSVIQMLVIQRQNKSQFPIVLSSCNGGKQLLLTNTQTLQIQSSQVENAIGFGCGIGPKIIMDESGNIAIVKQSSNFKEVGLYRLDLT